MYKITNNNTNDNYNTNNVRNQIKNKEPFAEGDGGFLYMESDGKVRKVFKSKFAFEGEKNVYERTENISNVVKVYKILNRNMHIIMEFVPYNLENLIIEKNESIDNFNKNRIINELVQGVIDLHNNKIYHNDYKAKNIQITADSGVRIIDFDLSDFGIINPKKRIEEINKLKYIILQIIFKVKYYPEFYNKRNKYLQSIDDNKFKDIFKFNRDNLNQLKKYVETIDFNNKGNIINSLSSTLSNKIKIHYIKDNTNTKNNTKNNKIKEFFNEFDFTNEEECGTKSYTSKYFIKKPILIKTINQKYPEIRKLLPNNYQKLPKEEICKLLFKIKNNQ